jgi:hypothetical protein
MLTARHAMLVAAAIVAPMPAFALADNELTAFPFMAENHYERSEMHRPRIGAARDVFCCVDWHGATHCTNTTASGTGSVDDSRRHTA